MYPITIGIQRFKVSSIERSKRSVVEREKEILEDDRDFSLRFREGIREAFVGIVSCDGRTFRKTEFLFVGRKVSIDWEI